MKLRIGTRRPHRRSAEASQKRPTPHPSALSSRHGRRRSPQQGEVLAVGRSAYRDHPASSSPWTLPFGDKSSTRSMAVQRSPTTARALILSSRDVLAKVSH